MSAHQGSSSAAIARRWWQREPVAGILVGWTLILAAGAIGVEIARIVG